MITMTDIITEDKANIHKPSRPCRLPLSFQDKRLGRTLHEYVTNSITPEIRDRYKLREAVGIASPQINVLKRVFAVHFNDLDGKLYSFVAYNPEIVYKSKEMIYLPGGEGCLSVDRETTGLTPRHQTIQLKYLKWDMVNKPEWVTETFTGYPAIVMQHECKHLDGLLYVDDIHETLENAKPAFEFIENNEK